MFEKLRVWTTLLYLFISSIFGYSVLLFPAVVLISPISLHLFYKYVDFCMSTWLRNTILILEDIWNIEFHFYSKSDRIGETSVTIRNSDKFQFIIANHATNFDWMFLWVWLSHIGKLNHVRNILKRELKNIPGFGWAMQSAAFIFLERNWEYDRIILQKMLSLFRKIQSKSVLVLFPEGTSLCNHTIKKSNSFAYKHGLMEYKYCLHPRTTGFNAILSNLIENDDIESIIDVTIAFQGVYPVEPLDLILKGILPKDIYILHCVRGVNGNLNSDAQREQWLQDIWKEKEETLRKFHESGSFGKDAILLPSRRWHRRSKAIGFIVWFVMTFVFLILLYKSFIFKIYMGLTITSTVLMRIFFSGITELISLK